MASPLVCWVIVGGLIIVSGVHGWGSITPLANGGTVELLWVRGRSSVSISGAVHPDVLAHGGWAHRRSGGARCQTGPWNSHCAVCVRFCLPREQGEGGEDVERPHRGSWEHVVGCGHRVWMAEGLLCPDGGCRGCLLNRCFRGFRLSRGRDVAGEGQSWEYKRGHLLWGHLTHVPKNIKWWLAVAGSLAAQANLLFSVLIASVGCRGHWRKTTRCVGACDKMFVCDSKARWSRREPVVVCLNAVFFSSLLLCREMENC